MSPFEALVERIQLQMRTLRPASQIALFVCASEALAPRYFAWCELAGVRAEDELLTRALDHAKAIAIGAKLTTSRSLLASVEEGMPSEPTDQRWFTAAQDCWICVDTAIRISLDDFDGADSCWYLFEPLFQAVSESLFGVTDVGSDAQATGEAAVLADTQVVSAVTAVESAIELLSAERLDASVVERLATLLGDIRP